MQSTCPSLGYTLDLGKIKSYRTNLQEFRRISLYDQTRLARFSRC